jgi:hypothetical protein
MKVKDIYPFIDSLLKTGNLLVTCGPGFKNRDGSISGAILERVNLREIDKQKFKDNFKSLEDEELLGINLTPQDEKTVNIELYLQLEGGYRGFR